MENLAGQNKPRKSENQIVVRCKHPIKIEKPLQSLLPIYYRVGERNILQTVLFSFFFFFFSVFIFSVPSKVTIMVIQFMFLGINIFSALLRAHFNPRRTARAKMSLSRAQDMFMPASINKLLFY